MPTRRCAFTMIELMMVMAIIGILLSFILVAAMNASRAAEERATQALISKLDSGLGDRIDALLTQRVNPENLIPGSSPFSSTWPGCLHWCLPNGPPTNGASVDRGSFLRAGVLARYDQLKHEVPDVFVVQGGGGSAYALNFATTPYTVNGEGNLDYQAVYPTGSGSSLTANIGLGMWGVTYANLTAFNKNLGKAVDPNTGQSGAGMLSTGYNGIDDNKNTLIDEMAEGGPDADGSIARALNGHNHVTARAEALYAFLVEGSGVYGSVFNRDDFTNREVRDTDNDGLPEFVDAWGHPLQFYRWPIFYHSDVQRGLALVMTGAQEQAPGSIGNAVYSLTDASGNVMTPYGRGPIGPTNLTGAIDAREQDPLDQNQQVLEPAWWSKGQNGQTSPQFGFNTNTGTSGAVTFFQTYFHQLVEPLGASTQPIRGLGTAPCVTQRYWDRSIPGKTFGQLGGVAIDLWPRRAFYTRFLILSAGPDGNLGTPYLTDPRNYVIQGGAIVNQPMYTDAALKTLAASSPASVAALLMLESQAAQASLVRSTDGFQMPSLTNTLNAADGDYWTNALQADGQDDITNHNLSTTALPVR